MNSEIPGGMKKNIVENFTDIENLLGMKGNANSTFEQKFSNFLDRVTNYLESKNIKNKTETKPFENYEYKAIDNNKEKKFNRIIFGAPGTGKSYKIKSEIKRIDAKGILYKEEIEEEKRAFSDTCTERVTFHPNYSYAQFVGSYKPVTTDNHDIEYNYVEGPFMRLLTTALENAKDSNKKNRKRYLLIVEEINRANVASVFGDMFQLLDRDKDGVSEYEIQTSEDVRKYLASKLGGDGTEDKYKTLKLPNNFYIWATMNSADQGVLPMDAAFKRRWDFEYIGIDDKQNWGYTIPLPNGESINWNVLRHAINDKLKTISGVNEDKLLGPYFISKAALEEIQNSDADKAKFINTFKSKVLMYLFEDVCKMRPADLFTDIDLGDNQTRPHYSDICASFDNKGIGIFGFKKDELEGKYKESK